MFQKITPILSVDSIEPALPFWVERLGFEVTAEVPHEDRLGFVILARDGVEVMYQTFASMAADASGFTDVPRGGSVLYLQVADIDSIAEAVEGVETVVSRRTTFYGADELFVREPGGHVVGFAEFSSGDEVADDG